MPALLIIAHAPLASALRVAAAHLFPEALADLAAYDVRPEASEAQTVREATRALDALGAQPVLILTDCYGATPCNVAARLALGRDVRVAVGVNLPMLWRSIAHRGKPLDELLATAVAGARMGVMPLADAAPGNPGGKARADDQDDGHDQQ